MLEFVQITYLIIHLRLLLLVIDVGYFQFNEVFVTFLNHSKRQEQHCIVFSQLNKPFFLTFVCSHFFNIISIWLCYLCWWLIILNLILKKRESFFGTHFSKQPKFIIPLISSKNLIAFQNIIKFFAYTIHIFLPFHVVF